MTDIKMTITSQDARGEQYIEYFCWVCIFCLSFLNIDEKNDKTVTIHTSNHDTDQRGMKFSTDGVDFISALWIVRVLGLFCLFSALFPLDR